MRKVAFGKNVKIRGFGAGRDERPAVFLARRETTARPETFLFTPRCVSALGPLQIPSPAVSPGGTRTAAGQLSAEGHFVQKRLPLPLQPGLLLWLAQGYSLREFLTLSS